MKIALRAHRDLHSRKSGNYPSGNYPAADVVAAADLGMCFVAALGAGIPFEFVQKRWPQRSMSDNPPSGKSAGGPPHTISGKLTVLLINRSAAGNSRSTHETRKMVRPTDEQQLAVDKFLTGRRLKIAAFAGAGKTTTLRMLAEAAPSRGGIYLAFHKGIATEAREKLPR